MCRVRYGVGVILDGYIAGPAGELDYLVSDSAYDQRAFFARIVEAGGATTDHFSREATSWLHARE